MDTVSFSTVTEALFSTISATAMMRKMLSKR